jgi:hypothetical protein
LLCGGAVTASYVVYQRGGQVATVADEKADRPAAETVKPCTDARDLSAHLVPASGPESAAPTAATGNDLVVTLQAAFSGVPDVAVRNTLTLYKFVCGAVRSWAVEGATADVQLLQFANKDETLNYYITKVVPFKQITAAADLAYVDGIDEGFVVTRKGADGRIHSMGFTVKGPILVVAEIHGKKRPDASAVGDLLRQQLEKA